MIAKLSKGVGFGGLVNYANNIKQKDTNIIASNGVSLTDNKTIASCFRLQAKGNPKVKQYVGHLMLSFSPKDTPRLTDEFVEKIAKDYLHRMALDNTQYVIFRHHDQPHGHVHIVYNRVDNDGKLVANDTNFRMSVAVTKAITREYGLTFGKGKRDVRRERLRGKDATKYRIYDIAHKELQSGQHRDVKSLASALARQGIALSTVSDDHGKDVGFTFTMNGVSFAGSKIDRELSFANVMQVLEPAERIADVITDLAVQPDIAPSMGGGGGSTSDLKWNDDDKERRRPQTTDYVPTRKPRR